MVVPVPSGPEARRALPGRLRILWLATLVAGLGWSALAPSSARARTYDPSQLPRAHYTAPLAPWPQASYRAKDFAIIKQGGWYHLFYTRVHRFVPDHWSDGTHTLLNETTFGHAASPDLETWFELDSVLTVPGSGTSWDAHHVWAPTVFQKDGVTWMFFTGVRDRQESLNPADWVPRWQVIGAAYTTDPLLQQWIRLPTPIWSPCSDATLPGVSWALCNATLPMGTAGFRDPFVMPPAAGSGDPWLMFYTARPRNDQFNYVVGVAQAASPLGPWSDAGALWSTYVPPVNSKVESPHVFRHGTEWQMFFTGDDSTTGIARQTASGSVFGSWTTQPSLNLTLGDTPDHPYTFTLEPAAWFASEHFREATPSGATDYFAVVHSYDAPAAYNPPPPGVPDDISAIEFRAMIWDDAAGTFSFGAPNPVRTILASKGAVEVGETLTLALGSEGGEGRKVEFTVMLENGAGSVPVVPATVGLPASVILGDDQTIIRWTVGEAPYPPPYRLVVAVASQPKRLAVGVDVTGPPPGGEEPGPAAPPLTRATPGRTVDLTARLDAGGAAPAIVLDLPAAGRVRIALYDATGRHVRTLVDASLEPGRSTWTWDGRDAAGRPTPRGVYFARLTSPFGARTARLLSLL